MKEKKLEFFVVSSGVCIARFLVELIFFFDIVIIPHAKVRRISEEEWLWYVNEYWDKANEKVDIYRLTEMSNLVNFAFGIVFILAIWHYFRKKEWHCIVSVRRTLCMLAVGMIVESVCYYYFKYEALHYRLFMGSTCVTIVAVVLFFVLVRIWYYTKRSERP